MEKNPRICKICNRRFANGKAMGGHMRSHFVKLTLPSSSSSLTFPSKHELSSEAESPKNPTRRRSKRLHKFALNSTSDSVSSPLSSEDAALCLLMLSRDHQRSTPNQTQIEVDYESLDEDGMDFDNETDDEFFYNITAKAHPKYYKCETCNKTFRSHQALGGHRASHNHKNKQTIEEDDENCGDGGDHQIHQLRIFECPFCEKVFQSGQALGGHKKVHFAYLPVAHNKASITSSSTVQLFDLNLPASEDDDDAEVSLVENSTAAIYGQTV